jgi:hypothetical protein
MSFIPKQDKTPKKRLSVQLRNDIADQANRYAEYLDSDLDHVVEQLFLKAFRSDKEFQKIAKLDTSSTLRHEPKTSGRTSAVTTESQPQKVA